MTTRRILAIVLFLSLAPALLAQQAIPTPDEYLGYPLGDRFTPWTRILDYFGELAKHSPLITVQQFGETYEHRPLIIATLTSGLQSVRNLLPDNTVETARLRTWIIGVTFAHRAGRKDRCYRWGLLCSRLVGIAPGTLLALRCGRTLCSAL